MKEHVGLDLISLTETKNSFVSVNNRSTESTVKDGVSKSLISVYEELDKLLLYFTVFNIIDEF